MPIWLQISLPFVTLILGALLNHFFAKRRQKDETTEKNAFEETRSLREERDALKRENVLLKSRIEEFEEVEHPQNVDYYILKSTNQTICPICWGNDKKIMPVRDNGSGYYHCGNCRAHGVFNQNVIYQHEQERIHTNSQYDDFFNYNGY